MKKFLLRCFSFFVLIYALAWGVDVAISNGLLEMEDYRFMPWNEMLSGKASAEVIIMGNSRGFSHFEPWTIDSICGTRTYCLGLGGYSITVETLKYKCYRLYNKKPMYIIQQVDHATLRNDFARHEHESEQFLPLIYQRELHNDLLRVGYSYKDLYIPLYRYLGYQMVIKNGIFEFLGIKHYVSNPSRMGHHYERGEWNDQQLSLLDSIPVDFDSVGKKHFEQYIENCYKENIKVILVNSPTYVGATSKMIGLNNLNKYFDSIANKYNTVYLNYNENYELCNDTTNFCMAVHMNPFGTHKFSIDFAKDVKEFINSNQ